MNMITELLRHDKTGAVIGVISIVAILVYYDIKNLKKK